MFCEKKSVYLIDLRRNDGKYTESIIKILDSVSNMKCINQDAVTIWTG